MVRVSARRGERLEQRSSRRDAIDKAPSTEEISELVSEVAGKERKEVPRGLANKIAASSERSMRRALLMLETASLGKLDESQELQVSRDLSLPPRATLTGGC